MTMANPPLCDASPYLVPVSRSRIPHLPLNHSMKDACFFKLAGTRHPTVEQLRDLLELSYSGPQKILAISKHNFVYCYSNAEFPHSVSVHFVDKESCKLLFSRSESSFYLGSTSESLNAGLEWLTSLRTKKVGGIKILGKWDRREKLDWDPWHLDRTLSLHNVKMLDLAFVQITADMCCIIGEVEILNLADVDISDDGEKLIDTILEKRACSGLTLQRHHGIGKSYLNRLFCSLSSTAQGGLSFMEKIRMVDCEVDQYSCKFLNRIPLQLLSIEGRMDQLELKELAWKGMKKDDTRIRGLKVVITNEGESDFLTKENFGSILSLRDHPSLKRLDVAIDCIQTDSSDQTVPLPLVEILCPSAETQVYRIKIPCPNWTHLDAYADALIRHKSVSHVEFDEVFEFDEDDQSPIPILNTFKRILKGNKNIVDLGASFAFECHDASIEQDALHVLYEVNDLQDENRLSRAEQAIVYYPKLGAKVIWPMRRKRNLVYQFLQRCLGKITPLCHGKKRKRIEE